MKTTLIYLHGLNSGPQTIKGRQIAAAVAALPDPPQFHLPQLDTRPASAIASVERWIARNAAGHAITFIGSSLGGFYAVALAERHDARAVLINPAIAPYEGLARYLGPQRHLYTGERWLLTRGHLAELATLRVARITRPERYFLLVCTGDELLDWRKSVEYFAGAKARVVEGGDHGWADFAGEIPEVLRFAGCGGGLLR